LEERNTVCDYPEDEARDRQRHKAQSLRNGVSALVVVLQEGASQNVFAEDVAIFRVDIGRDMIELDDEGMFEEVNQDLRHHHHHNDVSNVVHPEVEVMVPPTLRKTLEYYHYDERCNLEPLDYISTGQLE